MTPPTATPTTAGLGPGLYEEPDDSDELEPDEPEDPEELELEDSDEDSDEPEELDFCSATQDEPDFSYP